MRLIHWQLESLYEAREVVHVIDPSLLFPTSYTLFTWSWILGLVQPQALCGVNHIQAHLVSPSGGVLRSVCPSRIQIGVLFRSRSIYGLSAGANNQAIAYPKIMEQSQTLPNACWAYVWSYLRWPITPLACQGRMSHQQYSSVSTTIICLLLLPQRKDK